MGRFIFLKAHILKNKKNINLDDKILTQVMNRPYSIDIDEIDDFNYAKYLIEKKGTKLRFFIQKNLFQEVILMLKLRQVNLQN